MIRFSLMFLLTLGLTATVAECEYQADFQESYLRCEKDSDCISVPGDCCGCGGGGVATSINRSFIEDAQRISREACSGVGCLAVMSSHWSCVQSAPLCREGKCVLEKMPEISDHKAFEK